MKSFHSIPALMLSLSAALPANANTGESNDNDATNNTVVITATRTEQSLDSTLAATTVITREDIERYQPRDLPELLNRVAGLTISTQGTSGSITSLFTRGTNSNHTLIIVDGQRINSATAGTTAFQFINPEQIERIEIVRGARASLYGSDAIGGVIQIFTKQGSKKAKGIAKVSTGTNNSQQIQFGVQGGFEKTQFNLDHNYVYRGGFDSTENRDVNNQDDDAYINKSINTHIKHQVSDRVAMAVSYLKNQGEIEIDDPFSDTPEVLSSFELESIQITSDIELTNKFGLSLSTGKSTDYSTYESDTENFIYPTESNRTSAVAQGEYDLSETQTIVAAYDFFDDKLVDTTSFAETNRKTEAMILQYVADYGHYSVATSVRQDRIEHFGREVTESIDFGWHISPTLQLITSWGSAFKAPTFNDLYNYGGDPDLDPESSINREIGFKGTKFQGEANQFTWQVNAFQNRIDQLIQWDSAQRMTVNIDQAEIKGVELSVSTTIQDWALNGNVSYVDPENTATHKQLARRPKQTLNLDVDRRWQKLSVGASLHASNERFDDAANTVELAGFGTVDLRTAYHCNDELKFQLSVTNLFDQDYQLVDTYNTEGLGAMLSVVYQPTL